MTDLVIVPAKRYLHPPALGWIPVGLRGESEKRAGDRDPNGVRGTWRCRVMGQRSPTGKPGPEVPT